jgi:hypothetical protein
MLYFLANAEVIAMFLEKIVLVAMVVIACFALSRLADAVMKSKQVD